MKIAYTVGVNAADGSIRDFISTILGKWILPIFGAVALIGIIYGGILFVTSSGNPDQVKKARTALLYSVIGIVLVVLSIAIVNGLQNIVSNEILK